MALQLALEVVAVDVSVAVLADRDDVGDGLPPGELVGVMLERADEYHRAFVGRDVLVEAVAIVESRRDAEAQHRDEPVDRSGRTRPAEDDGVVVRRPEASADDAPRLGAKPGGLPARS